MMRGKLKRLGEVDIAALRNGFGLDFFEETENAQ